MRAYYQENIQLYTIFLVWLIAGMYGGPLIYLVIPGTLYLMVKRGMYEELFIGYFFILILSDSLESRLLFAKGMKNVYISFLAIVFLFNTGSFYPLNKLYRIYMPFFLFSVVTILCSVTDSFFFTGVQKTLSYFLSFLVVPNFMERLYREHGIEFIKRFVMFCFTTLVLGFIFKYISHDLVYLGSGRYRGVMGNPNGLGIYTFLIFIVFYVVNDFFPGLFSRNIRIAVYVAILLSIYMTNSRNAVFAVLIFYVFQRFYSGSPFLGFILFALTVYVAEIVSANFKTIVIALGLGDFFRIKTLEDGSGRYIAWGFAWQHIQENFFIGKGFAYNEYYMRRHYRELAQLGHQGGIHNSFLTFWMDQGLLGLLIFLRSYVLAFIKAAGKTKFAYPIMFAVSFTAVFESWLVGSLSAYAFLLLVILTLITSEEILPVSAEEQQVPQAPEVQLV